MIVNTAFEYLILIFTLSSSVIVLTSFSSFLGISDIIHYYTVLAFQATNPNNSNNITIPTHPNNIRINHTPVANVGPPQSVKENATVMLVGAASDPNPNDKLSYSWKQIEGPAVKLNRSNTAFPTFTAPSNMPSGTELKFALTARDHKGASSNPAIATITIIHVNHTPIANAGTDHTVNPGYIATLDGSQSKDPDNGDRLTYTWKQISGPPITLNDATSPMATFTAPSNILSNTTLAFQLIVKDSKNANNTSTINITDKYIPPPNQPPTANVGKDQTVNATSIVKLDGTKSKDPDGNIVFYSWMQTTGPAVTLNGADTSTPSFTAPNVSSATLLKFALTVKDDKGIPSNNPAIVVVNVKTAPAPLIASVPGNQAKANAAIEYVFVKKWGSFGTGDGQFNSTEGISIDSSGNVYVVDGVNGRIQKFDSNGKFITKWGSTGSGDGQFDEPRHIAIDSSGNVYVTDTGNDRIQKFDNNGTFTTKWGSNGTGDGQFNNPEGIAVDSSGNVYVADSGNNRIQKFDSHDKFITKWGSNGTGDGQFDEPWGIVVDSSGNVYVADSGNSRIQKFDNNGKFITKWGSQGTAFEEFVSPTGVAFDSSGYVYVVDGGNNRIQKFDSNGKFITKWGPEGSPTGVAVDSSGNVYVVGTDVQIYVPYIVPGNQVKANLTNEYVHVRKFGSQGSGDGQFTGLYGVTVDSSDNVYVVDGGNNRIQKFDSNGKFITKWGSQGEENGKFEGPVGIDVDSSGNVYVTDPLNYRIQKFDNNGKFITKWGSNGTAYGQFDNPTGISIDSSGNVYVVDSGNSRIQKFDNNGKFITTWGDGSYFYSPTGVAVDSSDNVYVVDGGNNRIQKFDSNGKFITKWGTEGGMDGKFSRPTGIAADSSGNVYVVDSFNSRIQKFESNGNFITNWKIGYYDGPYGVALDSSGNVYVTDRQLDQVEVFAPSTNTSK